MKRWIERVLDIQPGDIGRGFLLTSCLFLIIGSFVIGKVARDALFLTRFQAVQLPYADIASGVLGSFIVAGYLRVIRGKTLRNLLVGSQLFFAANCLAFWILAELYHPAWLYPAFYIWVSIFGVLAPTQVWTLANHILTTREAKSVFGMVGAGAILGSIFAGFLTGRIAHLFGTESLLLLMVPLLVISAVAVYAIVLDARIQCEKPTGSLTNDLPVAAENIQTGLRLIFSSDYLRAVAAIICISSFVTTVTGWQFKAIAQQSLANKDHLAIFFGNFYFYTGIIALIFQLFLTSRFLRRFGIGTMLIVLPITIFLGSTSLLIWGSLVAVVLLKSGDQVLRFSLDKSTVELMYLPLASRVKSEAKWFIDTVIWRVGDGLAGVIVLIFATYLHFGPRELSFIVLLLTAVWLWAAYAGGGHYLALLQESISKHRLNAEQISAVALDKATSELLARKLQARDTKEILYALTFYEGDSSRVPHPAVRTLLRHSSAEVRQKSLEILSASQDLSIRPTVEGMLKDPDIGVRTEAMLYLVHHAHVDPLVLLHELGEFQDFSVRSAVAAFLARPGEAQDLETARAILDEMVGDHGATGERTRSEAARLLGSLPDQFDPMLARLLDDTSSYVVREAIQSIGKVQKCSLVPQLLRQFHGPWHHDDVTRALIACGNSVVDLLGARLGDPAVPIEERQGIPLVLAGIGTKDAAQVLQENVMDGDNTLRFKIISALNKLHRDFPEIPLDLQLLEAMLAAEILGHYRTYQILDALDAPASDGDGVTGPLESALQQELERIFRLLGLLYTQIDLHSVYLGLQSRDKTVYDNALELLESVLKSSLRVTLVPLLDGRVTPRERARLANQLVRIKLETREQAVKLLISSQDPWLKSCGVYAIGSFRMKSLAPELDDCLKIGDPFLRETARAAKLRLNSSPK